MKRMVITCVGLHISECMVLIIHINHGIKEHTCEYQNCNTSQILIFGEHVKRRKSLYTRATIWVNIIINHINTVFRYEGSCMVYRPKRYQKCESFIIDTPNCLEKDNNSPTTGDNSSHIFSPTYPLRLVH